MDIPSQAGLNDRIKNLELLVGSLRKDKINLIDRCESSMAASRSFGEREKEARQESARVKSEMHALQEKYNVLQNEFNKRSAKRAYVSSSRDLNSY